MVKPTIFLDANILFSAAYQPHGRSAALFELSKKGHCQLSSSRYAVLEAERNLRKKRPETLEVFSRLLRHIQILPEASSEDRHKVSRINLDEADIPILAAAIGRAPILVTGDKTHFGHLMGKKIFGVQVLGLAEVLAKLLKN